ncbi:DUF3099 domain-containing protein [Corynebacterium yudongzhengii]|uniref:DUF3099 domain-containing protein n=2 Tax=Corynebacterium yudongzhengii TaxID=2080740 RepID=A0A2U1T4Y8_9CORY|nr:DUF3099 domain-containing protein [Corynebacterium yudongzhengii]PWC01035.1 DUF3099 domain-containing protein [Corynebacterium yudongzhengii]
MASSQVPGLVWGFMNETLDADDEGFSESRRTFRLRRGPAELITDARPSSHQNRRRRQKWYWALQLSRVPTTILAGLSFFWWDNLALTVVFFILAVPAPALAVVLANEKGPKLDKRERNTYKPGLARQIRYEQVQAAQHARELDADEKHPVVIDHDDEPTRR